MVENNNLPDHYNDIDKIYDEIWSRLKIGKKDRNSEFHQCYVASTGNEFPSVRTVVLRHVNNTETWSLKTSTNLPNYLLRERIPSKEGMQCLTYRWI